MAKLARWSEHYLWRQAAMVLPVTEVLAQEIAAAGVPRKRMAVIANGVDPGRFRARKKIRRKPLPGFRTV